MPSAWAVYVHMTRILSSYVGAVGSGIGSRVFAHSCESGASDASTSSIMSDKYTILGSQARATMRFCERTTGLALITS